MAEPLALQVGDVVHLKGGSPALTVILAHNIPGQPEYVTVAWFDGGVMHRFDIERRALQKEPVKT